MAVAWFELELGGGPKKDEKKWDAVLDNLARRWMANFQNLNKNSRQRAK